MGCEMVSMPFQIPRRSARLRSEAPSLRGMAPGGEGVPATWTTGAKDGIGTSFYNPDQGPSLSNVWYTLSGGTLTEVYYPDVSCANLRVLQLAITDGLSFSDLEETDTTHKVELVFPDALIYRQTNTAKSGKYRIEKTYVTHPQQHALLVLVSFYALVGNVADYRQFVYVNPVMNNGGRQVHAEIYSDDESTVLLTSSSDKSMAVAASAPFVKASAGYAGVSDGLSELKQTFDLGSVYAYASNGNVTQIAQVQPGGEGNQCTYTLAIGFGPDEQAAVKAATTALADRFEAVVQTYRTQWQTYLSQLSPPPTGDTVQYNVAVMVLKAHEDKRHPGAMVASLTIPWGDKVVSTEGGIGGYHLVWSRDFYQVVSTLLSIGDRPLAKRCLRYLDEVQQQPDGSFPQNSWLDGTPYWRGLQMDQVAFPILLAYQLGEIARYPTLVKPAADFIVENGPFTAQERWEENSGYSPSTLAAEIAGLVVAAKMAHDTEDLRSAALYLATADDWVRHVKSWTLVNNGPLSEQPYFLRISDTQNPADGHWIEIKNGGGWRPKDEIVDAGFLELVRLGILAPDDPVVTHSLDVVDEILRYDAPYGPVWKRYNQDGYGEQSDGSPYHGNGMGRPWPLLAGERGEYEVAFDKSPQQTAPTHLYGPRKLLATLAGAANDGYLIPEQVWDGNPVPQRNLYPGGGTGSATPLAWAMAQYIRLSQCIRQGRIVEMPDEVVERYHTHPADLGPAVQVECPDFAAISAQRGIRVCGQTAPYATVLLRGDSAEVTLRADAQGRFEGEISLWAVGENIFHLVGYDNHRSVSVTRWMVFYQPKSVFEMSDPVEDDNGPGWLIYPTHSDFKAGDFDLCNVRILHDDKYVYFEIGLRNLDNPWEGPTGISKQLVDVYLHLPELGEAGQTKTRGLRAQFRDDTPWHRLVRISGNWHGEAQVYRADGSVASEVLIQPQYTSRRISARVLADALGGYPTAKWAVMVLVAGEENGGPRPVRVTASKWDFGGGSPDGAHSDIIDMMVPDGMYQRDLLNWQTGPICLPMLRLS
ncbi:hypothetical protein D2Q93_14410 [Alicyclobacillaceae bacterium I2511]|nr:hypothetical protein D2Q93_14410 [Alicyclobacillaceae bacterium I2511]